MIEENKQMASQLRIQRPKHLRILPHAATQAVPEMKYAHILQRAMTKRNAAKNFQSK